MRQISGLDSTVLLQLTRSCTCSSNRSYCMSRETMESCALRKNKTQRCSLTLTLADPSLANSGFVVVMAAAVQAHLKP